MCDCIEVLEKKILEKLIKDKSHRKPVEKVTMKGKTYGMSDFSEKYNTDFEITLTGQVKKPTISVRNTHCQFCGEKYE